MLNIEIMNVFDKEYYYSSMLNEAFKNQIEWMMEPLMNDSNFRNMNIIQEILRINIFAI